ncbi:DUF928 domain-containing protein [Laspinema olomoucense]|uniref:DUF928 domain-containing protein n=1 Tax=Laspinema olomoucense TaxID=3231600 RepID=UPI0021BB8DBE|nr:DUF928 domain-containing protein [Laspinema sp. D3d]MCT7971854.1 DUF928 domain-containing protein [Laspinema sp. D3d]
MSHPLGKPSNPAKLPIAIGLIVFTGIVPVTRVYGTSGSELRQDLRQVPSPNSAIATVFEPPDPDPPEDREGSGSRTSCPPVDKPLTGLIASQVNYTLSGHPTFWFYVPYPSSLAREVEFVLLDEEETEVYKTVVPISDTPGIVSFRLPENIPALEVGKQYLWQFSYRCNPRIRAEDDYIEGMVQRIAADSTLISQLEAATTLMQRVELYAANGLWHETLTTLAELRRDNPGNAEIADEWTELLESIGLGHLANEAIGGCCRPLQ